jgi:hypothetical protein
MHDQLLVRVTHFAALRIVPKSHNRCEVAAENRFVKIERFFCVPVEV